MSNWGFFEWLTYVCVAIAALVLAADAAFKGAPAVMGRFSWLLDSNPWHFAPIALISISAIVILSLRLGWIGGHTVPNSIASAPPQFETKLEPVIGRTFMNQTIVIDGKDFSNCTFRNVNFRFRGGWYAFSNAKFEGSISIDTDNEIAQRAINFFVWLDAKTTDHALSKSWTRMPPEHFK